MTGIFSCPPCFSCFRHSLARLSARRFSSSWDKPCGFLGKRHIFSSFLTMPHPLVHRPHAFAGFITHEFRSFHRILRSQANPDIANHVGALVAKTSHNKLAPTSPASLPFPALPPNIPPFIKTNQERYASGFRVRFLRLISGDLRIGRAYLALSLTSIDARYFRVFMWHQLRSFLHKVGVRGSTGATTSVSSRLYHGAPC
jgi:hypothetical protein